jgi:hypothetical protein
MNYRVRPRRRKHSSFAEVLRRDAYLDLLCVQALTPLFNIACCVSFYEFGMEIVEIPHTRATLWLWWKCT